MPWFPRVTDGRKSRKPNIKHHGRKNGHTEFIYDTYPEQRNIKEQIVLGEKLLCGNSWDDSGKKHEAYRKWKIGRVPFVINRDYRQQRQAISAFQASQ
jgi:hypothetical protein